MKVSEAEEAPEAEAVLGEAPEAGVDRAEVDRAGVVVDLVEAPAAGRVDEDKMFRK